MSARADLLDNPEPIGKWLAGSLALHLALGCSFLLLNWVGNRPRVQFGDIKGGGIGSVSYTHLTLPTN